MSSPREWDDLEPGAVPAESPVESVAKLPQLYFGPVDEFVREIIIQVFRREVEEGAQHYWSARWWEHPEAVMRLAALWRA